MSFLLGLCQAFILRNVLGKGDWYTSYIPSSCSIFVYKLETPIYTKIVPVLIFVLYIKLMKLVVYFMR